MEARGSLPRKALGWRLTFTPVSQAKMRWPAHPPPPPPSLQTPREDPPQRTHKPITSRLPPSLPRTMLSECVQPMKQMSRISECSGHPAEGAEHDCANRRPCANAVGSILLGVRSKLDVPSPVEELSHLYCAFTTNSCSRLVS